MDQELNAKTVPKASLPGEHAPQNYAHRTEDAVFGARIPST